MASTHAVSSFTDSIHIITARTIVPVTFFSVKSWFDCGCRYWWRRRSSLGVSMSLNSQQENLIMLCNDVKQPVARQYTLRTNPILQREGSRQELLS